MTSAASRVVVVDVEALRALVREEIARGLREHMPANDGGSEYLSSVEVGRLLGVHPRTIAKMVSRDGLPAHRFGAKLLRFKRSEVVAWLEAQAERPGAHEARHRERLRVVK